jgi:membrane-associated phospholipid phosphatase
MKQNEEPYTGLINMAHVAGEHAVLLFAVSLVLAMVVVLGVWGLVHRYGVPREDGGPSRKVLLVIHLAASFGVIVGAGALFAAIADEIGVGETLGRVDQAFADGIASAVPIDVIRTFALITHLGDAWLLGIWCVLGAAILTVRRKYALATGFVLAIVGNGLLNNTFKHVFERVRPVHDQSIATASGWSFPSGHSSGSLVTYGIIAYVLVRVLPEGWRLPTVIAATVIARALCERRAGGLRVGNGLAGGVYLEHRVDAQVLAFAGSGLRVYRQFGKAGAGIELA